MDTDDRIDDLLWPRDPRDLPKGTLCNRHGAWRVLWESLAGP